MMNTVKNNENKAFIEDFNGNSNIYVFKKAFCEQNAKGFLSFIF